MSTSYRSPRTLIESRAVAIPELFEWNAQENPEYALFRFPDGSGNLKAITYAEAIRAIRRIARYVLSFTGNHQRHTVAILANTGSGTPSLNVQDVLILVDLFRLCHVYYCFRWRATCRSHPLPNLHPEWLSSRESSLETHGLPPCVGVSR